MVATPLPLLLCACLVVSAAGIFVINVGECPKIPTKPDFELNKYLGLWFSYENFDAVFQWGSTCVNALYSIKPNGRILVINSGYEESRIYGKVISREPVRIEGEAFVVDPKQPAGLNVRFGGQPDLDGGRANYLIVDTDYDNFSIVYSCSQFSIIKFELAWILTRERGVRPANYNNITSLLESYGVHTSNFKRIDHSNCSPK